MRKEMSEYFASQPEGTTEVMALRRHDTGQVLIGVGYKCSQNDWRYLMQAGRGVPVGPWLDPRTGIRVGFKLVYLSIFAWIGGIIRKPGSL